MSDCAAEGLKAVMALQSLDYTPKPVTPARMRDCIDTILSMQNPSGGFASYELQRGSPNMEYLNAAEVFGELLLSSGINLIDTMPGSIMIDYMYTEWGTGTSRSY